MFHIFDGISLEPLENLENRYNPYILVSENSLDPLYTNSAEFVARSYEDLLSQLDCKTDLEFFKSLYANYPDITVQIFASPKQYAILFLKSIKLIFGKNLGKEKAYLLYQLSIAKSICSQKIEFFKERTLKQNLTKPLSETDFYTIYTETDFSGDIKELTTFRKDVYLKYSLEYLIAHLLFNQKKSKSEIDEKVRRVIFNCFKRTNLENIYLTQMMDYPLYNKVEDWKKLPDILKVIQKPIQYSFKDINSKIDDLKNLMQEFYPEFYEFSINTVGSLTKDFGSLEFLKNNIDFLFSDKKIKQVFFDHGAFFATINRYTMYLIFTAFKEGDKSLLKEFQIEF